MLYKVMDNWGAYNNVLFAVSTGYIVYYPLTTSGRNNEVGLGVSIDSHIGVRYPPIIYEIH